MPPPCRRVYGVVYTQWQVTVTEADRLVGGRSTLVLPAHRVAAVGAEWGGQDHADERPGDHYACERRPRPVERDRCWERNSRAADFAPFLELAHLRVMVARPAYLLAMSTLCSGKLEIIASIEEPEVPVVAASPARRSIEASVSSDVSVRTETRDARRNAWHCHAAHARAEFSRRRSRTSLDAGRRGWRWGRGQAVGSNPSRTTCRVPALYPQPASRSSPRPRALWR